MNSRSRRILVALVAACLAVSPTLAAEESAPFEVLFRPYDTIRQLLVAGELGGLGEQAATLRQRAAEMVQEPEMLCAGVSDPRQPECTEVLRRLVAGASMPLILVDDLAAARTSFAALSTDLVALRDLLGLEEPVVARCPMVQQSWLQPAGEISNPFAAGMERCGEIVAK